MEKYLVGRDDILFLDNDHNAVLNQITGQGVFQPWFFEQLAAVHLRRRQQCRDLGISYFHVIVPNKETSLCDYLPEGLVYEAFGPTPARRYLSERPEVGEFTFYDPDCLAGAATPALFYPRQDSHWKTRGAVEYLRRALSAFAARQAEVLAALAYHDTARTYEGDLGLHAGLGPEEIDDVALASPGNRILFQGNIANQGYARHQVLDGAPGRLLCLHDSFTQMLFETIGNLWGEALSLHVPDFGWDLLEAWRPDVVLFIQIERFLPRAPVDDKQMVAYLRELAEQKGVEPTTAEYVAGLMDRGGTPAVA
jgi:hypothetical protein